MYDVLSTYSSIWCVVAAIQQLPGEPLEPIALSFRELSSSEVKQIGLPQLLSVRCPPYPTGPRALIVAIDAQQLAGLHVALGWHLPERIIDLLVEHRNQIASRQEIVGGLAGALISTGASAGSALITGTSPADMSRRLDTVVRLFTSMRATLDIGRALLRGRYLCTAARIERIGVPIDTTKLARFRSEWSRLLDQIVASVDQGFHVYRGRRFDVAAFSDMLRLRQIEWPRTILGALDLSDDTFREMARLHPDLCPLKEVRSTLIDLDPHALTIGRDGRNRVQLRPFASKTGRNQPSAKASILGCPAWARHVIRPVPGTGIAMLDFEQQELGIAAALSDDEAMKAAYEDGDAYMALAIAARAAPKGGTSASHPHERERFKRTALGVQYGIGRARLARQLGISESAAQALITNHKSAFPKFWSWADRVETSAYLRREIRSVFGWRLAIDAETKPGTIRNFPMQANGAEILRLACCMMTEAGISVCAPNHDAVLIETPLSCFEETVFEARRMMAEASAIVLDGFTLRTSVRAVRAPENWTDPRGKTIWAAVQRELDRPTCSPE